MQNHQGHPSHWLWIGLAVMFVLIGASVFISVIYPNGSTGISNSSSLWGFVGPLIGLGFLIFFVFGWAWFPNSRRYTRRWRYFDSDEDNAIQTLRQRYARGEITKEQLEQMTKDLEQHSARPSS